MSCRRLNWSSSWAVSRRRAGVYVCRVRPQGPRGEVFLVTDGGLHQHLAASGTSARSFRKISQWRSARRWMAAARVSPRWSDPCAHHSIAGRSDGASTRRRRRSGRPCFNRARTGAAQAPSTSSAIRRRSNCLSDPVDAVAMEPGPRDDDRMSTTIRSAPNNLSQYLSPAFSRVVEYEHSFAGCSV